MGGQHAAPCGAGMLEAPLERCLQLLVGSGPFAPCSHMSASAQRAILCFPVCEPDHCAVTCGLQGSDSTRKHSRKSPRARPYWMTWVSMPRGPRSFRALAHGLFVHGPLHSPSTMRGVSKDGIGDPDGQGLEKRAGRRWPRFTFRCLSLPG